MDIHGRTRFRPTKSPPSNRYLGTFPQALSSESTPDAELNEDDIFTADIAESNHHHHHHHHNYNSKINGNSNDNNNRKTNFSESSGILAALPESPTKSHFYHKASVTSSSRTIPAIPKRPQERASFGRYQHHSAPVNVPMLARAMKDHRQFDDVDDDEDDDGVMVPPHEMVARAHTPLVACSVVEGVGRTLKGRDLRQVRNAVWRRIGFMG